MTCPPRAKAETRVKAETGQNAYTNLKGVMQGGVSNNIPVSGRPYGGEERWGLREKREGDGLL